MGDYPDFTRLIHIIGADIMVPIDLQGAYVMMPVDIQAQYVNLEVDIVAQTIGNIDVNIAAADIGNISVDITAQTIGDITISIDAQNIGVRLQPDWSAVEDEDKEFRGTGANVGDGYSVYAQYTVTAGKSLYITHIGVICWAYNAADKEKVQICGAHIEIDSVYKFEAGGNGGVVANFTKPLKATAGEVVNFYGGNYSGHACNLIVTASGYEI